MTKTLDLKKQCICTIYTIIDRFDVYCDTRSSLKKNNLFSNTAILKSLKFGSRIIIDSNSCQMGLNEVAKFNPFPRT